MLAALHLSFVYVGATSAEENTDLMRVAMGVEAESAQATNTFCVMQIIFQLTSWPFLVCKVGFVRDTLTNTGPTGYNRNGLAVATVRPKSNFSPSYPLSF